MFWDWFSYKAIVYVANFVIIKEFFIEKIFTKFDDRFSYIYNYNRINDSMEPDLNDYFNCGIISKQSLIIGTFKKTIENFN